jgi:predicted 2-oxoglutarate/Fe(II)-dependent dioxygenase YbiX/peroxiredoxin
LYPGDPAPHFKVASSVNPSYHFDVAAGRYIVLSFFGSSRLPFSQALLEEMTTRAKRFDVTNAIFFGVSIDPSDRERLPQQHPGIMYFWDLDRSVSRLYGLADQQLPTATSTEPSADRTTVTQREVAYEPRTFVLDQALRVVATLGFSGDPVKHADTVFQVLDSLPALQNLPMRAPIIIVPDVFEPELCRRLIDYYEAIGGEDSGFMREVDGKTVGVYDYAHKRRMDCEIVDQALIRSIHQRLRRRVVPAIRHAYQFDVTRIERNIVARYDAAQGAHFRAHRDNTTMGTAHRRFAVTLNLNSDAYEGGEIWFPEFGPTKYKGPTGSAIVFSCSMLHEVPKVTSGKRYAYLPFLYDDAAAAVREQNRKYLGELSMARGGPVTNVCASRIETDAAARSEFSRVVIDGSAGCGNPEGCQTCLTSPTYPLIKPADHAADGG